MKVTRKSSSKVVHKSLAKSDASRDAAELLMLAEAEARFEVRCRAEYHPRGHRAAAPQEWTLKVDAKELGALAF